MDDQIPSVPSSTGVQVITYSKLLNQVILFFSVSNIVDFMEQYIVCSYDIICFPELVKKCHFCGALSIYLLWCISFKFIL